jgi:peptide/nickel transport system ATP-binding protein
MTPLLSIRGLRTWFYTESGIAKAVDGLDLDIQAGEVVGLVGESGSGKSVTALSILRLIPDPPGKIVEGEILFAPAGLKTRPTNPEPGLKTRPTDPEAGLKTRPTEPHQATQTSRPTDAPRDLLKLSWDEIRKVRGRDISMVFQEPMTSLNPVFTIGMQVTEAILLHERCTRAEADARAIAILTEVGIPDAASRMKQYPHHLSGGQRQRVMIAMALALNPSLLIADEPTTALDVTIQAQILDLMLDMKAKREGASILLITHNLSVVAETCDRVAVMYGGKIQEIAPVEELFANAYHPYTRGLLGSIPGAEGARSKRLAVIPGSVPDIHNLPAGCKFVTRCPYAFEPCPDIEPPLIEQSPGHAVRCHLYPRDTPLPAPLARQLEAAGSVSTDKTVPLPEVRRPGL